MREIHIASPDISDAERNAVEEVLNSERLAQGPRVAEFEQMFAEYCEAEHAVMVNSGTAAIHTALSVLEIGPGDEVITTPFSFIATANPILMQGAKVTFADIEPNSFNIDPHKVSNSVTNRTKAIIAVDLYGQPYDYPEISSIAERYGLYLIEDACQAIGASIDELKAGVLGDIACFSLYATKNIMAGEGGVMVSNSLDLAEAARSFRQHGMVASYEYEGLGYNYRSTDLAAAIAIEQLKRVDEFNGSRQSNAALYDEALADLEGIILPQTNADRSHVYHQYTLRVGEDYPLSRKALIDKLAGNGIGTGVYYPKPLHLYDHIKKSGFRRGQFPEAEKAAQQVLSLPVHPQVNQADILRTAELIREEVNG